MQWVNVNNNLPDLYEVVWICWRDREVLLACRTYESDLPSQGWYSFDDEKCKWTNWWMRVRDSLDQPNLPKDSNDTTQS